MMKNRKHRGRVLGILWMGTAALTMAVLVIYFGKLGSLYRQYGLTLVSASTGETADEGDSKSGSGEKSGQTGEAGETGNRADAAKDSAQNGTSAAAGTADGSDGVGTEGADTAPGDEVSVQSPEVPEGQPAADSDTEGLSGQRPSELKEIDPASPIIAFSFDDGPSVYTERIVKALQDNDAEATFFMVGYNIDNYPERVKMVYDAGFEIGNHTLDHKELVKLSEESVRKQVFDNEDKLNAIVPVGHVIVRPPYGSYDDMIKRVVNRPMACWSVDSLDWKTRNAESIVKQIKSDAKDGYIILMHDIYETSAEAVELILPWLKSQGYQVTSISRMYEARGEELLDGHVYRYTSPAAE